MFTSFAGIFKNSTDYISCVMLRRKWRSLCPNLEFDSFEFLLLDNDGSTVQATAQKDLGSQFDCLLIEGNLYNLRSFDFIQKPKSNFLTEHDYIICLREDSVITQCKDPFPYDSIYRFKSFPDVLGYSTLCDGPLFDVIGTVVDIDERLDGDRGIRLMLQDGEHKDEIVYIPRMTLSPSDSKLPFRFQRRQFPIMISYAMSINKSQGQSLSKVGILLRRPVFTHGQLYVAVYRVTNRAGLKLLCCDEQENLTNKTTNVVYKKIFRNLQ